MPSLPPQPLCKRRCNMMENRQDPQATSGLRPITPSLQKLLDSDKISVRIQNELYLRSHPEIANILNYFVNQALKRQPTNIPAFAAELLGDPQLEEKVTRYAQDAEEFQKTVGGLT